MNGLTLEENSLCHLLSRKVKEYFKDEQHRREFEEWYRQRHGTDFDWRKAMRDEVEH